MKRVKEAEHLSFPLQGKARGGTKSAGEVVSTFKPEGEHESAVEALLAAANLTDKGVAAAEDEALRGQDLSPQEIEARRAELRYQRELMFRAEQKAKRVSKIKSKTFRKLARKRAAKAAADGISLEDLERLDLEAAEEERERLERERARERATLRHGARSRFGRGADGEGTEAEAAERRSQRNEMLAMRDKLQRKIHGRGSGESSSESEESGDEGDEEAVKARAFDQLAALGKEEAAPAGKKGLMQMKFMQKAEERRMREVADEADALRRDIEMFGEEKDDSEDEDAPQVLKLGEGRMVFSGPGDVAEAQADTPAKKGKQAEKAEKKREVPRYEPSPSPEPAAANPWLDASASAGPSRKKNVVNKSSEAKAVRALKKAARPQDDDVDEVEINVDVGKKLSRSEQKKAAKEAEKAAEQDDSDSSDDELLPASGVKAFKQRALVAEAFAGDDVVADFAAEKQAAIDADAPQEVDTALPGWGGWGGKGVRKRKPNAKFIKKTAGVDAAARKDAGRANVIISEKKDRKAAKFLPTDLPFPFTSIKQYEAQFANPVGSEWNARAGFQRQTLPRVTKKPGAIIEPIRKLF
jgi:U3 small nucleolar RNA-associated protein 14